MSEKSTNVTIEATARTGKGKSFTRKLRAAGKIPAVLNSKGQSTMLELDPKMLSRAWRDNGKLFDMTLDGKTSRVKITELQLHPVKRLPLHVDLAPAE
jgi:large subunit ribosomal protein L25